jgi:hypothetical protein
VRLVALLCYEADGRRCHRSAVIAAVHDHGAAATPRQSRSLPGPRGIRVAGQPGDDGPSWTVPAAPPC